MSLQRRGCYFYSNLATTVCLHQELFVDPKTQDVPRHCSVAERRTPDCEAFCVQPLTITLRGITNDTVDPSVDIWRTVTLPLLRNITGLSEGFELKIVKRGAAPEVRLLTPCTPAAVQRLLPTVDRQVEPACLLLWHPCSCLCYVVRL